MARGTQFRELVNMLRAELGNSLERSTGLNQLEAQKYALRNTYEWLWDAFDWRFLKVHRDENLEVGQRYYAFDAELSYENVEKAWTWHGETWRPVEFGIRPEHYDHVQENEQRDPIERWDAHESDQYEVWPTPASDGRLRMYGVRKFKPLRDEHDVCLLDDLLVVFYTAARMSKGKSKNAPLILESAQARLRKLRAKTSGNKQRPFVLGGGSPEAQHGLRPGIDYIPERR